MKLNHECVRDLMLYFEKHLSYTNDVYVNQLPSENYSKDDLIYTAEKLNEAGFINCIRKNYMGEKAPLIIVNSITYKGHSFLDNIRDNKVWSKTKGILSNVKSASIEVISETAAKVISNLINPVG
ncbi:MAG: DUF2513 domain-containing protein [Clostridia bacterium]|nr:DUF2513 domain-containing protein [Clostridia bacterium]